MAESTTPEIKPRPIVRLAIFLISHCFLVSVVCFTAGVVALLLLPVLAKNTYVSENALMPGSANTMLSSQDIAKAYRLTREISDLNRRSANSGIKILRLLAEHMTDLGAEVSFHNFHPQLNQFHPLNFFAGPDSGVVQKNFSCSSCGVNTVGIVRAPRSDGKEAIVLVTPYNSSKIDPSEIVSLGVAYSVFSQLAQVTWLAKDIIWLAADSQFGEYTSVSAWLRDYHTPVFSGPGKINSEICDGRSFQHEISDDQITEKIFSDVFRRAGTMAAALVLKVVDSSGESEDTVRIYAEASNGQMPNLDLINIVKFLAVHRQGFHVKLEKLQSLLHSKWVKIVGVIFELVGEVAKSLNPQWKFGIPVSDYIEGSATLASSLYFQALGVPTGSHGAFRDYQVDAITLEISPGVSLNNKARKSDFILRGGRLIEGVIRSINNLLEKFHQSFFLYLLSSPGKFVSVGVYMIGFALLVAPLPMVAASLYADDNNWNLHSENNISAPTQSHSDGVHGISVRPWKWLRAEKQVFFVHFWGASISLLPYFICQIPNSTPTMSLLTWVLLSGSSLIILHLVLGPSYSNLGAFQPQNREWGILKSVMISATLIGLCLMSVINFATAEIGALLLVPMCLIAHPLKLDVKGRNVQAFTRAALNMIFGLLGFPPVAFLVLKGMFGGLGSASVGDFWSWLESLWAWNSATYLYIVLVHLPCWVLCIHILFHPC